MLYLFQRYYIRCTYSIIKQQKKYLTTKTELKAITATISNSINNNNNSNDNVDSITIKSHNNNNINSFPSITATTTKTITKTTTATETITISKLNNDNNTNEIIESIIDNNNNNHNKIDSKRSLIFQQCSGIRKRDGKQCSRKVPVHIDDHSPSNNYYCHNHRLQYSSSKYLNKINKYDNDNNNGKVIYSPVIERTRSIQTPSIDDGWSCKFTYVKKKLASWFNFSLHQLIY